MTIDNPQSEKLLLALKDAKIQYLHKMAAIASTGAIVLQAEHMESSPALKENFDNLKEALSPYNLSSELYFAGSMLFSLITEVELYFTEAIKSILIAHPKKLGSTEFKLAEIVERSREEIVLMAAEKHLNSLMYKKPNEYLAELCKIMSIESTQVAPLWPAFIEAKARRDLGIHNNWLVNDTYLRKLADCGIKSSAEKNSMICPRHVYIHTTIGHCRKLVMDIADLVEAKFSTNRE